MSRARVPESRRHQARLLAGHFFREPKASRSATARVVLLVGGILLVVAGIALAILPVVPGFPLTILGVLMIASASSVARRLLNASERRLPTGVRRLLRRVARRQQNHLESPLGESGAHSAPHPETEGHAPAAPSDGREGRMASE